MAHRTTSCLASNRNRQVRLRIIVTPRMSTAYMCLPHHRHHHHQIIHSIAMAPLLAREAHPPALSQVQPLDFSVRKGAGPTKPSSRVTTTTNGHHQNEPLDFSQEKNIKSEHPAEYGLLKCDTGSTSPVSSQGHELRQRLASDSGSPLPQGCTPVKPDVPELVSPSMSLRCALPTMVPETRRYDNNNGSVDKTPRPFKAYPKDVLSLPLGYYGLPGLAPITNLPVNGSDQQALRPEDLVQMYQDQLIKTQELIAVVNSGKRDRNGGRPPDVPYPGSGTHPLSPSSPTQSSSSSSSPPISSYQNITSPLMSNVSTTSQNSRKRARILPEHMKDSAYWERRRKNNEAAKRSRDARRAKEDEIAIRAALLEQENLRLRVEVAALKTETAKLKGMLYSS